MGFRDKYLKLQAIHAELIVERDNLLYAQKFDAERRAYITDLENAVESLQKRNAELRRWLWGAATKLQSLGVVSFNVEVDAEEEEEDDDDE